MLLSIAVTLVIVGFLLWLVNTFIPMQPKVNQLLNVAVVVLMIIWFLNIILGSGSAGNLRLPTIR